MPSIAFLFGAWIPLGNSLSPRAGFGDRNGAPSEDETARSPSTAPWKLLLLDCEVLSPVIEVVAEGDALESQREQSQGRLV